MALKNPMDKKPVKAKGNIKKARSTSVKRDNFLASTVQRLRDMAGNVCSFPGCHVHTHGSKALHDGPFSIGVACHIKAAAPGGPRYDTSQTQAERKDVRNGVWMCQTHSKLVDADDSPYPVETLHEWKRLAEIRANEMVNKRAFTELELKDAAHTESVALLERWVNRTGNPIDSPIIEVMEGYEAGLESLDPRFKVQVNRDGQQINHVITPASKDANFCILINDIENLEGFLSAEKAFFEEGRELVIPSSNFELAGSKLFEAIHKKFDTKRAGSISLSSIKKPIKTNFYACDLDGHEYLIESFISSCSSGAIRAVINGACLSDLLVFKVAIEGDKSLTKLDMSFNLEAWKGLNILELPLFSRLVRALSYLEKGHFVVEFEIENELPRFDSSQNGDIRIFVDEFTEVISALHKARKIAEKCESAIILKNINIDERTQRFLNKYSRLISGPVKSKRTPSMLCWGHFKFYEGFTLDYLNSKGKANHITINEVGGFACDIFGQTIKAPRISTNYINIESLVFSDLDNRESTIYEVRTTEETLIESNLLEGDHWEVLNSFPNS
ncbi:hypothetical protein H8F22_07010 [Pseudomonas sp. P154a]|uniref:hypothetical protein n=1 Tax=Pseudomonas mucoides TaxID=2730424 RepID=UPI001892661F|nr:hypothetical protein [Pseudomonas mucoides]MBF6038613.1 hypothetical protein [Pseudomonas mucoides]